MLTAQLLDHGLAHHVVRQARKGLRADDVGRAMVNQVEHLGREQPAFAHVVAHRKHRTGLVRHGADALGRLKAAGLLEQLLHRRTHPVHELDERLHTSARGCRASELILLQLGVAHGVQEEVQQARHHGLAALALDNVDHVVVGCGVELDQDLADHAHARLGALTHERHGVERADGLAAQLGVVVAVELGRQLAGARHVLLVECVGGTGRSLVWTTAIKHLHHHVAKEHRVDCLLKQRRRNLKAGVVLTERHRRKRDHRNLGVAALAQGLADECDVVGGTAAAAGLADNHGRLGQVVPAALDGLHNLAGHQNGRIANVIVHIAQAGLDGVVIGRGQQLQVVAGTAEHLFDQVKVDRRHLRAQDGVALLAHLLGKGHLGPRGRCALALSLERVLAARECGGIRGGSHRRGIALLVGLARGRGLGQALGLLVLKRGHERADADARSAQVGHLVDLEHGVNLAAGLQNLLHLIGSQSVQAAAERVELDQVQVVAHRNKTGDSVQAAVVHPLVDDADGALGLHQVRKRILGKDRKAKARDKLGQGVVDLGVVVVGAAGEHDAVTAVVLDPLKGLLAHGLDVLVETRIGLKGSVDGGIDLGARDLGTAHATATGLSIGHAVDGKHLVQAALELGLVVIGHKRVQELDILLTDLVDIECQRRGVAHDDGAVIAIASRRILLALPAHARHPDKVDIAVDKVHHVAVAHLGRIAHALGRHGLDACLVGLLARLVGQLHAKAQARKERVPEGVVLVHVECARDTHGAARGLVGAQHLAIKEQLVFLFEEVRGLGLLLFVAGALLAAVAGNEAPTAAKVIDGELAVVGAATAADVLLRHSEVRDVLGRKDGRGAVDAGAITGEQGRTIGAHAAGDVGTHGVNAGELLKRAQRGIGHKGAALDDHLASDLLGIAQLNDLEQGILNDRIGQTGRDVAHRGAFLLRLLNTRIHKDRAATAQVHRSLGMDGCVGERAHVHVHRDGEALDKATAARRAGLVEHDVLDNAVLDAQALHVLTANVQDKLDAGQECLGSAQVRDGLDLAGIGLEGLDEQRLAVTRGGHVADGAAGGDVVVEIGHDDLGRTQDVTVVIAVPGMQQLAVLTHKRGLHGGGTGVDTDEHATGVAFELALGNDLGVVAGLELGKVLVGGKERIQTLDLGALCVTQGIDGLDELRERAELIGLVRHGGTARHKQVSILGHDAVLLVQVEREVKAMAQLGEILQRAAQEGDVTADGTAARQARDGLGHDGLEDGGGHVLGAGALVEQRLDVGLGKNAAAAGDGIDGGGVGREFVKAAGVGVQQGCHLVDERTRTAGTGAVHALLDAVIEVDDLGVLAAQLDGDIGGRDEGLDGALAGDDLLDKLQVEPLGQQQAARAGNGAGHLGRRQHGRSALEQVAGAGANVGVMALVLGVDDLVVIVEHGELDGGGANVDAQVQVAVGVVGVEDCAFGGVGGGGWLASDGRLPCRVLGIGNCLGNFLGSRGRGLLCGVHHGGRSLACGGDHAVLDALDEFAHCLSS